MSDKPATIVITDAGISMSEETKAKIAADPEMQKFLASFKEAAHNAVQAVQDGRYPDFGAAMAAQGFEGEEITADEMIDELKNAS